MISRAGAARRLGAGSLLIVAAIHANWARGSSWPVRDERSLAQAVIGHDHMPSSVACLAVASLLSASAGFVMGMPRTLPRLQRLGAGAVVAVLGARGLIGCMGLMPHEHRSVAFKRWNRRLYSPLCLALAALCAGLKPLSFPTNPHRQHGAYGGTKSASQSR